ncbi:MAG: diguanylate cyclase [Lachnospiraceae bacterium]|nr:diguanylate cyclase [Lachnospiraceae bacterium]
MKDQNKAFEIQIDSREKDFREVLYRFEDQMIHACLVGAAIQFAVEAVFFFFITFLNAMYVTLAEYIVLYLFCPLLVNALGLTLASLVHRQRRFKNHAVTYAPIVAMFTLAFSMYLFHAAFEILVILFVIPMLVSVAYGSRKVLINVAIASIVVELVAYYVTALILPHDYEHFRGNGQLRIINQVLFIIVVLTVLFLSIRLAALENMKYAIFENMLNAGYVDPLTGLRNRKALREAFEEVLKDKDLSTPHSLIAIDVDYLEGINASMGRQVGDEYLKALGRILLEIKNIQPFRYEDDEFLILTNRDIDAAQALCFQIVDAFSYTDICRGKKPVSLSFGVEQWDGRSSISDWIRHSNVALNEAKRIKSTVMPYEPSM